jgi:hypothetical protein
MGQENRTARLAARFSYLIFRLHGSGISNREVMRTRSRLTSFWEENIWVSKKLNVAFITTPGQRNIPGPVLLSNRGDGALWWN